MRTEFESTETSENTGKNKGYKKIMKAHKPQKPLPKRKGTNYRNYTEN